MQERSHGTASPSADAGATLMNPTTLKVMVFAGGPDQERAVSLQSGATVAKALRDAGHEVVQRDISPRDLSALDEFDQWKGDVIFPALHGGWGEGGGLQRIMDERGVHYVGCRAPAAELCMDKVATKIDLIEHDLPTLPFELVGPHDRRTLTAPLVIKPPREGSSIDLVICHDDEEVDAKLADLWTRHDQLLIEKFCEGMEITVGVLDELDPPAGAPAAHALPPIRVIPAGGVYDYDAKYNRDDTQYVLDPMKLGLLPHEIEGLGVLAVEAYQQLGCRHMARIDFIVDENHRPWILEVNTIPGFTSHSLLPMAAGHAGISLAALVDRLVRLARRD